MRTLSRQLPVCSASTQKGAPHVHQLNKIFKLHLTHLSHFLWHSYLKIYLQFVLIKGVKTHEHANACHDCFDTHSSLETRGTPGHTQPHGEPPEHRGQREQETSKILDFGFQKKGWVRQRGQAPDWRVWMISGAPEYRGCSWLWATRPWGDYSVESCLLGCKIQIKKIVSILEVGLDSFHITSMLTGQAFAILRIS